MRFRPASALDSDYSLGLIVPCHIELTVLEFLKNPGRLLSSGSVLGIVRVQIQVYVTLAFIYLVLSRKVLRFFSYLAFSFLLRFEMSV